MKNIPILQVLFVCFAFASPAFGQAGLERQVIGLAGNTLHTASGATLNFTVGEAVVSEQHNPAANLSQGFHQILVEKTTLDASALENAIAANIQLFPNPAQNFLQINTDTPLQATLFDLNGRQVMHQANIESSAQLDISTLSTGTYILRSSSPEGQPIQSFKIQIIH